MAREPQHRPARTVGYGFRAARVACFLVTLVAWLSPALLGGAPAFAQAPPSTGGSFDNVDDQQGEDPYEVNQPRRVWLRGVLDARVVRGGEAPSWTDSGRGRTRYGSDVDGEGFERETKLVLAQLAIELGATLPWEVRAQAQVNVQPDLDDYRPWLVEAFVRKEWGVATSGRGLQAGLMGNPFSLEHVGPAWSPQYSISASALNSWLWEEISVAGLEGEWWREAGGLRFGMLAGAGFGPDQLGRLVAVRGWTMGDVLSGVGAEMPLPSGVRTQIFDERDDRPAAYALLTLGDARERAALRFGYFDNFGDENVAGVWNTRFGVVGASFHLHPRFELLVQYLDGEARVRDTTNDSSLRAWYALLSHHQGRHRVSVRYDSFRLQDVDGGSVTAEDGEGVTFAWFWQIGLRHQLGFEYVWLDVDRRSQPTLAPSQDGGQLSYRFRY